MKYLLLVLLISCASVKEPATKVEPDTPFYIGDWESKRYVYLYKNQDLLEKDILAVLIEQRVGVDIKENGDYDKEVSNTIILGITSEKDVIIFEDEDMKNIIGEDNVVKGQFESGYWKPFSNHEIKMFPSISPVQNDYEIWSFRGARSGMFLKRFGSVVLVFTKQ